MGVRLWMCLFATSLLLLSVQTGTALAEQNRPGRLVTLDNKEIVFDSIKNRDLVKGWWNGSASRRASGRAGAEARRYRTGVRTSSRVGRGGIRAIVTAATDTAGGGYRAAMRYGVSVPNIGDVGTSRGALRGR